MGTEKKPESKAKPVTCERILLLLEGYGVIFIGICIFQSIFTKVTLWNVTAQLEVGRVGPSDSGGNCDPGGLATCPRLSN